MSFAELIAQKKIIVCLGSGGVGKTTVSAAIGFLAAQLGKKTLIVTIDPAKRLADAIGLHIGSKPELKFKLKAPLYAMMLDMESAWADLVMRLSPSHYVAKPIFENRFYYYLAKDMAGSQEFVACEMLYTLASEHDYDLIVLDTPPSIHALDFLDAPKRILSFLDQEAFHFFLKQKGKAASRFGLKFLGGVGGLATRVLAKFIPGTFLQELTDFLYVFSDLYAPLIQRTHDFQQLLKSQDTAFVIVLDPKINAIQEARQMFHELKRRQLPFEAFIANRLSDLTQYQPLNQAHKSEMLDLLKSLGIDQQKAVKLLGCMENAMRQENENALHEAELIRDFREDIGERTQFFSLPRLSGEVASISALLELLPGLRK